MTNIVTVKKSSGFIKRKGSFDAIVKKLQKISIDAIEMLETTMNEKDCDPKLKIACATKLLEFYTTTLKQQNDDEVNRLQLEYKHGNPPNKSLETKEDNIPQIDFDTVSYIETDTQT